MKMMSLRLGFRVFAVACITAAIAVSGGMAPIGAIPVATPPPGHSGADPTPPPPPDGTLPYDSSLLFVLDDPISSTTAKADQIVRAHLKDPLVLGSVTLANSGAPVEIRVLRAQAAKAGDEYGYVDIYFLPLVLPDGKQIPLRAPTSHLTTTTTAGHDSTVGVENTVEDIFIPYAVLYQVFRKGRNFTLGTGAVIRARTAAGLAIDKHGDLSVQTALPVAMPVETPANSYQALPYAVGSSPHPGNRKSHPAVWTPSPEPSETPEPTAVPSASSSPSALVPSSSASPSPSPSASPTP
jgi:hypothetical protein